ncbi:transporter substrate-binding domain-containing protein [Xylophilus rhododendri]|uniref:Transporter substrate-binding domain-containing protein n=2 Tax=Xylophilus rhododendri TaxID=2697032 RepID=A0A857JF32_9BURK|nr:transporter substrate-binding domain-containing protein [Xylophilus rhododendri]
MVRVVTETTPNSFLQDGRVVGRGTELVELTLQRAGLRDYRIDLYPWARAVDLAQREPNVLIYPIARTADREERFRWVGEIQRIRYFFYALPDRALPPMKQLDEARGLTIGVVRDDVRHQFLQRKGFTRLVLSGQPLENLRKLLYRQVDLVAMTENEAQRLCEEARPDCAGLARLLPLDELQLSLFMAYSRATPEDLAQRTTTAFESLRADGSVARTMGPLAPGAASAGR